MRDALKIYAIDNDPERLLLVEDYYVINGCYTCIPLGNDLVVPTPLGRPPLIAYYIMDAPKAASSPGQILSEVILERAREIMLRIADAVPDHSYIKRTT